MSHAKIQSVSDAASTKLPPDSQVLDLHGYTVIPGLVGMHDHLVYPVGNGIYGQMAFSFPRLYLAGAVTSIRTTGALEPYTVSPDSRSAVLADKVRAGDQAAISLQYGTEASP